MQWVEIKANDIINKLDNNTINEIIINDCSKKIYCID